MVENDFQQLVFIEQSIVVLSRDSTAETSHQFREGIKDLFGPNYILARSLKLFEKLVVNRLYNSICFLVVTI